MSKYKVIALVGESGTGKDTILYSLSTLPLKFNIIISHTTRPKRDYEIDGVDYYFTDLEYFNTHNFIETSEFNTWKYGTSMEVLREDKVNVGVFNPEGIRSLWRHPDVSLTIIRLRTPGDIRLLRQLTRTEHPDTAEIVRRYHTDLLDFEKFDEEFYLHYLVLDNRDKFDLEVARVEIGRQIRLKDI